MTWVFVWLLVGAGFQVSETFATQEACENARSVMSRTHLSDYGREVEQTYACQRVK